MENGVPLISPTKVAMPAFSAVGTRSDVTRAVGAAVLMVQAARAMIVVRNCMVTERQAEAGMV